MWIEKIQIQNFRNIKQQFLELHPGINYFVANNAEGKTTLLESIYYLGHNKSFKTKNIKNIIQDSKESFLIQALLQSESADSEKIEIKKSKEKTLIKINNSKILNSTTLTKKIPIQIIAPDKGFLLGGDNKNKRYYINWGLFHVKQDFVELYKKYKKIQKNINQLILQNKPKEIDVWFKEFANTTVQINTITDEYMSELKNINTIDFFNDLIFNLDSFDYKLQNGLPLEVENTQEEIYNFLIKNKEKILKNKYLKYGPHLTTLQFFFKNKPEERLSRGEQKTLSIIFWLTQVLHLLEKNINPIVLIDDISSELDAKKVQIILDFLKHIKAQTFITSIHPVSDNFWEIKNGEIGYNS